MVTIKGFDNLENEHAKLGIDKIKEKIIELEMKEEDLKNRILYLEKILTVKGIVNAWP